MTNVSHAMHSLFSDAQRAVYMRNNREVLNSKVLMLLAIVPRVRLMVRFFFREHRFNTAELGHAVPRRPLTPPAKFIRRGIAPSRAHWWWRSSHDCC
jgi:hypothetical protein